MLALPALQPEWRRHHNSCEKVLADDVEYLLLLVGGPIDSATDVLGSSGINKPDVDVGITFRT